MENYLFLLELFVDTVTFSSNLPSYPRSVDVVVSGGVGKDIKMDVFTVQAFPDSNEEQKEMQMNCGRSTLFACTPDDLLAKINSHPFEIVVYIKNKPIGSAPIYWTKDFYTLVKKSKETFGVKGPVSMQDQFLVKEKDSNRIMGDIKASVKLSAFGNTIQTSFQLLNSEQDAKKKFLIKGARGQTTFQCQKMNGESDDLLPLTCLFSDQQSNNPSKDTSLREDQQRSWMALFKSTLDPQYSTLPEEFNVAIANVFTGKSPSALTFDIVSLMEKPEENKYIDLRIRGGSHGFIFEFEKPAGDSSFQEIKFDAEEQDVDEESLTIEKINRMLCKNKDCPAAKKFKEFGIGPLATTKGLGTVYGEPSLPITYGISQTYGVFDEYGPYGLFSRPKRPSQPFIPKEEKSDWHESCWKPKSKKKEKPCDCHKHDHNSCYCQNFPSPLRLTGGGVLDYDDVKSPFHECKEVMDQFDEVLRKYKKALGPCGQVTCPFAPNVTKESCKQRCQHEQDVYSVDNVYKMAEPTPTVKQPVKEKFKVKGACGSTKCAYAKYKRGLQDEDAEMELQYLPAAPSGQCGHPKCPYPVEPDLPPIHWDCPDPLPKGRCKNPDCPYLPKEIKCLNAVLAKGPCGNFNCPFTPPPPCDSPTCPFATKECPYAEKSETESVCENPECPYAPKKENSLCDNPECPYMTKKEPSCVKKPPSCRPPPYPTNPCLQNLLAYYAMMTGNCDLMRICYGGPECPYMKDPPKKKPSPCYIPEDPCANPKCPYVTKKPSPCYPPNDSCTNPECPYMKKPPDMECGDCEEDTQTKNSEDFCGNSECPYAPKTCFAKPPPCYPPPKEEVCQGPPCPYNLSCLQALLPYFNPITICPDGTCPYGGTGLQDLLQLCMAGMECPSMKPCPPPAPQPCMVEEKNDGDICANPSCPFKSEDKTSTKGGRELNEGVEYTSETRVEIDNAPCNKGTCKAEGGELVCTECPCHRETGGFEERVLEEGLLEYKSDTRVSIDLAPCTPKTCKSKGGKLVCDVCPCTKGIPHMGCKKKKKNKGRFVYTIGDKYPGVHIGHKECVLPGYNVPPRMGWLWNIFTPCLRLKPRRGWRPGAISKIVAERIRKHREAQGLHMLELKDFRRGKKGGGAYESGTSINIQPKPTLHIKKHDGCYWITMNPLKDPHTLVENESPYMDCTPMQFKIVKNKKEGEEGYKSCFCDGEENEESSSESELEIEFTPPAGIIHPERFKRKRNVVHCDTQYLATDFEVKSEGGKKGKKGKKDKKGKKGGKKGKKGKKK
ncbi:uncharacterized protein LOC123011389 [Tribolium madens]|uniref:uncharacterized protein LOC123011389 n=1 Tax=Tribolium madens TaxID=41895 RepID=UPI001CF73025|nr:uncharacterized protein LOC123011389 [Tribolium madens]